jgi:hypothetical protein
MADDAMIAGELHPSMRHKLMMLPSRLLAKRVSVGRFTRILACFTNTIRNHMNHGGASGEFLSAAPFPKSGPREALELGLDAARATQNILRLLESSTHGVVYSDALDTIWHSTGKVWARHDDDDDKWILQSPIQAQQKRKKTSVQSPPRLEWLNLSDNRTALAKIQGMDGTFSYISMLRLDSPRNSHSMMLANDGWQIVRQVHGNTNGDRNIPTNSIPSIYQTLEQYLSIEHGGGEEDALRAQDLFAPDASLLAVGTAPLDEAPTDWSAPTGSFLEISFETYIKGVSTQTPHDLECQSHDQIVQVDVLPCRTVAAATVHVGNGAQSLVFVDHLLLGRQDETWKLLSKIFTPRAWPAAV